MKLSFMSRPLKPFTILLVEDDEQQVELAREVFEDSKTSLHLHDVHTGRDALRYLRREGKFLNAVKPDLILLDLNLPGIDGREVLKEIKNDDELKMIPVVVLTTSDSSEDVQNCYELGANSYIAKPVDLDEFSAVARSIEVFWFKIASLPFVFF